MTTETRFLAQGSFNELEPERSAGRYVDQACRQDASCRTNTALRDQLHLLKPYAHRRRRRAEFCGYPSRPFLKASLPLGRLLLLQLSTADVRRLIRSGKLPAIEIDTTGARRVSRDAVDYVKNRHLRLPGHWVS